MAVELTTINTVKNSLLDALTNPLETEEEDDTIYKNVTNFEKPETVSNFSVVDLLNAGGELINSLPAEEITGVAREALGNAGRNIKSAADAFAKPSLGTAATAAAVNVGVNKVSKSKPVRYVSKKLGQLSEEPQCYLIGEFDPNDLRDLKNSLVSVKGSQVGYNSLAEDRYYDLTGVSRVSEMLDLINSVPSKTEHGEFSIVSSIGKGIVDATRKSKIPILSGIAQKTYKEGVSKAISDVGADLGDTISKLGNTFTDSSSRAQEEAVKAASLGDLDRSDSLLKKAASDASKGSTLTDIGSKTGSIMNTISKSGLVTSAIVGAGDLISAQTQKAREQAKLAKKQARAIN